MNTFKEFKEAILLANGPECTSCERSELAYEAAEYLAAGGYVEDTCPLFELPERHDRDCYPIELCTAAVNVAIAYGDLTGLEGLGLEVSE